MYHPINSPDCETQLQKLTDLAQLTIAFGLENEGAIAQDYQGDVPAQSDLANRLGAEFLGGYGGLPFLAGVRARFVEYFEAHGNRKAGEWLWSKPMAIGTPVVKLLVIPLAQKQGILNAFNTDQNLEARFAAGNFLYSAIPPASAAALGVVKTILRSFYNDILAKSGVPAEVLSEPDDLDRQVVLRAYMRSNRRLKVCPGCDGSPPSVTDVVHADVDHIFPKSKYPFLAIHPVNLTPFCKDCNQTFKKDKDALDASGVTSLVDIYHPYLRPAKGKVEVVVERDPVDGQPHLHLCTNPNDPQHTARLSSLNYLLKLEVRWDGDLQEERLGEKLIEAFRYASGDDRDAGIQPNLAWFQHKISIIVDTMQRSVGSIVGEVPALAYTRWVASDPQATTEWLDVVRDTLF